MKKIFLLSTVAFIAFFSACKKSEAPKPEAVSDYVEYNDAVLNFGTKYPKGWAQAIEQGKMAVFYSSPKIQSGFSEFDPQGERGAKIMVGAMKGGEAEMQNSIEGLKSVFTDPNVFKNEGQTTVNGMPATKISYSFEVEDTKVTAERFYVIKDSVVSFIETGVIGNFDDYKAIFDEANKAFKLGAEKVVVAASNDTASKKPVDLVEPPSATFKDYAGASYSIQYPSNFGANAASKGGVTISGARNDCSIIVDMLEAKGVTLDKIVEQNKKAYKSAASATKVGNQQGYVFQYNGGKNVSSRAYFTMKGDKLYRITLNYFTPQKDSYLPAFEKCVSSFAVK